MKKKCLKDSKKYKIEKKNCDWNEFLKIIQNFNITFYPKENNDKTNLNNKEIIKVDIDKNTNKKDVSHNDGSSKKGMSQINTEENKRSAIPNNINKVSNKTYEEQKSNHCKIINKKNSEINESIINNNSNNSIINNKENYKDHLNYNQDKKIIGSNINSQFKNAGCNPNGIIEKKDVDVVEIKTNGNCLYRSFSYFLFGTQDFYLEIKNLIIEWIENYYEKFIQFFGDVDKNHITKEELV